MSRRGIDAAAETAKAAAIVVCGTCTGNRKVLGELRRSTAGLVFDAPLPGGVTFAPGQREALMDHLRELGSGRLPIPVAIARSVVLIDDPNDAHMDPPTVECKGSRIELTREHLRGAAAGQMDLRKPVKIVIHHVEHNVK